MNMQRARTPLAGLVLVGLMVLMWIVGSPPLAGPDEPAHIIRAAALARTQLDGEASLIVSGARDFELPIHIGFPDPGCYAFQPEVPASCATSLEQPVGDGILPSRSADYPVWGHLLPGLATFGPASTTDLGARLLDAVIPVLLLGLALYSSVRRGWLAGGALLLATTPLAWFTIAVVNPSGAVIAGGIALWAGLVAFRDQASLLDRWLIGVGWAALALPRRDGLIWAALIVALAILALDINLGELWRRIGRGPQAIIAGSTVATLAWAMRSDTNASQALLVTPFVPLGAAAARGAWQHHAVTSRVSSRRRRLVVLGGAAAVMGVVAVFVMSLRSNGFDRNVMGLVVGRTGADLNEAIGVLGWVDAPIPQSMVFLWVLGLGLLTAAGLLAPRRELLLGAAAVLVTAVAASWVLTMLQNDEAGTYWQGRYYLPLLVGMPILLGRCELPVRDSSRIGKAIAVLALIVANVAFAAAIRRWAVGLSGSLAPWNWDTYNTLLPPAILMIIHAGASVGLFKWVSTHAEIADGQQLARQQLNRGATGVNVLGYHQAASGLGAAARQLVQSFQAAGVPCIAIDVPITNSAQLRPTEPVPHALHNVTIAVVTAAELPGVLAGVPDVVAKCDRMIGYWFWELDTVPDHHRGAMELVDSIWAPTTFVRDAYAGCGTPVELQPLRLPRPDVDDAAVAAWRHRLVPNNEFLFVVTLDLFSIVERKNPFGAIEAFVEAFGADRAKAVRLVIKTMNGEQRAADLDRINVAAEVDQRIIVVDECVSSADLDGLIAAADCYVSLHRSEGLGLGLGSAMWSSTPVLATGYSGNLDFTDDQNAALVQYRLIPVSNGQGAYPDTAQWADPDIAESARWMVRFVIDRALGDSLASAGHVAMERQNSAAEFGAAYADAAGWAPLPSPHSCRVSGC